MSAQTPEEFLNSSNVNVTSLAGYLNLGCSFDGKYGHRYCAMLEIDASVNRQNTSILSNYNGLLSSIRSVRMITSTNKKCYVDAYYDSQNLKLKLLFTVYSTPANYASEYQTINHSPSEQFGSQLIESA